jgi:hypothetical protein
MRTVRLCLGDCAGESIFIESRLRLIDDLFPVRNEVAQAFGSLSPAFRTAALDRFRSGDVGADQPPQHHTHKPLVVGVHQLVNQRRDLVEAEIAITLEQAQAAEQREGEPWKADFNAFGCQ